MSSSATSTPPITEPLAAHEYLLGIALAPNIPEGDPPTHVYDAERVPFFLHADVAAPYPYVVFSKSLAGLEAAGYVNATTIANVVRYGHRAGRDYIFIRDQVRAILMRLGYAGISTEEKEMCCRLLLLPASLRLIHYPSIETQFFHVTKLNGALKIARQARMDYVTAELRLCLATADYDVVMSDVMGSGANIAITYLFFGRLGSLENSGETGILDYVLARAGTPYEASGFRLKPFVPTIKYASMDEFAASVVNTLATSGTIVDWVTSGGTGPGLDI